MQREHRAFIHVLDLNNEASICIFLGTFATFAEEKIGMGIFPDGERLFVRRNVRVILRCRRELSSLARRQPLPRRHGR